MNKLKGDQYETYIKNFLLENNKYVWLWKDIPVKEIINAGIRTDLNKYRIDCLNIDDKNPLIDTGVDILFS